MSRKTNSAVISSKGSIDGRTKVHIPELRITVYTKNGETPQQTRERYLATSVTYKKR